MISVVDVNDMEERLQPLPRRAKQRAKGHMNMSNASCECQKEIIIYIQQSTLAAHLPFHHHHPYAVGGYDVSCHQHHQLLDTITPCLSDGSDCQKNRIM